METAVHYSCLCCSFLCCGRTPHTFPLLWCEVPPTGEPVNLHELFQRESFPQVAVPCELLQPGSLLSGTDCCSMSPPGHTGHRSKPPPAWDPLSVAAGPVRSLLQHRLPRVPQPPSGLHLLLHRLRVHPCSPMDPHGLQGHCLTMVFTMRCR